MLNRVIGSLCVVMILLVSLAQAEPKQAETPAEGLLAVIHLLEKDDLKSLFLQRYGELERFAKTEEEKQKIAAELTAQFAGKKEMLLEQFRKAKGSEPELAERNGQKVAIFKLDKDQIKLYLKNGVWMFHL